MNDTFFIGFSVAIFICALLVILFHKSADTRTIRMVEWLVTTVLLYLIFTLLYIVMQVQAVSMIWQ